MGWYRFTDYIPVAERRSKALKALKKLKKKDNSLQPIFIEGRFIANTFWGKAWCKNLELYSDYSNRLERGRSYLRHGAVIDLKVTAGKITALVCGASIYQVEIEMTKIIPTLWSKIVKQCANKIDSLIELLQGKFSKAVMEIIADPKKGLFPQPKEIKLNCSCPDWADMCKHVAAVLYGIGARLDSRPEELFTLRQADHIELIAKAGTASLIKTSTGKNKHLLDGDLATLFDIDMGETLQQERIPKNSSINLKKKKLVKHPNKKSRSKIVRARKSNH